MSSQKWLNCRLSDIRQRLDRHGHKVSKPIISRILRAHGVTKIYDTGVKISDAVMASLNLRSHDVCPQWNYTICPRSSHQASEAVGELILL